MIFILVPLIFLIGYTIPVGYLIFGSLFFQQDTASLNLATFVELIISTRTASLLMNTLGFALGGSLIGTLSGFVLAWLVVRTDVPGKRFIELVPILSLTMPFLVKAFAWIYLFSPKIGLANLAAINLFGLDAPIFNIYSIWGLILGAGTGSLPFTFLAIKPAVESLDPSLEESSRVGGAGIIRTIFRVTGPLLLPSLLSSFLLVFIFNLESFDYPLILGTPGRIGTLSTEIYYWSSDYQPPNYANAAIISIIQLILTFSAFGIYIWVTRKAHKFVVVTGKITTKNVHRLRRWKYVAFALCFIILLFNFFLPFSILVLMSLTSYVTVAFGKLSLSFVFLKNFYDAISLPLFYEALLNTIAIALLSALSATFIGVFLSYAALKSKIKGARLIEFISAIPLAFPGIVYGLALFWTFLMLPGISNVFYGTWVPLVIALVVIRIPYAVRMVSSNLMQISNELEEASRVSGASFITTIRRITLPLLKGGLMSSFKYIYINSLRELGVIVLLVTPQTMMFMLLLLRLYSQHAFALNTVAAASVILSLLAMLMLLAPSMFGRLWAYRKKRALLHKEAKTNF